jgi:hypothetical protein
MSYKTLYEELWESNAGEKGYTRVQAIFDTKVHKGGDIVIRKSLTETNKKYNANIFFPSYKIIKTVIFALVGLHGKSEVERELGIKINGGENK